MKNKMMLTFILLLFMLSGCGTPEPTISEETLAEDMDEADALPSDPGEENDAADQPIDSTDPTEEIPTELPWVQGTASDDAYIRYGPGLYCDIINVVDRGTLMNLMEFSASLQYLMTDVLGPDQIGWVWINHVEILGDEGAIPRGDALGCLGCGDSTCSPEIGETCATCEGDCGPCCGNGTCEAGYNENCATCAADCGSCCGNGNCEGDLGENPNTCPADCHIIIMTLDPACINSCGNFNCQFECGENYLNCPIDCLT